LILEGLNAKRLDSKSLRVLDVCSGSGCISLLLHSLLAPHVGNLTIAGLDVSPQALNLALKNREHNINGGLLAPRAETEITFRRFNIFNELDTAGSLLSINNAPNRASTDTTTSTSGQSTWDVLISNPPYISPSDLIGGKTSRSVRKYEPMQALVPPIIKDRRLWEESLGLKMVPREDIFYPRLLYLARKLDVKLVVFECGDVAQAQRIVDMARVIFAKGEGNENLSIYIWSGYDTSSDCDDGARAVVVKRF
jgi:tRNA1(Val) A37 N6-methylase TrmN6